MQTRVMVPVPDASYDEALQMGEVLSYQYLKWFWSYRADMICDRQTDGWTDRPMDTKGKNNVSRP